MKAAAITIWSGTIAFAAAQITPDAQIPLSDIANSAATTEPYSPVSHVEGLAFNRLFQVWFENIVRLFLLAIVRSLTKSTPKRTSRMQQQTATYNG
jgi:hypothetical protein